MHNWFLSKVQYEKILENGMRKKVTEPYLIDAMSWTEAEARTIEEIKPYVSGEFTIADISRYPLYELFFNEKGDRFYKTVIAFITLDEKSGLEKKTKVNMLAQASNLQNAKDVIVKSMEGILIDYEIIEVKETPIMDVFLFSDTEVRTITL
ncbi:MAG: DUF4494 domain-containing protein [Prevotella sp.]|jgi:hypothetical protein|nr:DUF4494 domain-containing protein [Prevotella sp.]